MTTEIASVIACLREGVIITGRTGEVLEFNQAALDVLSLTEAQLRTPTLRPPQWRLEAREGTDTEWPEAEVRRTGQTRVRELSVRTAAGSRELLLRAVPLAGGDRVVTSIIDVSRELQVVSELRVFERFFDLSADLLLALSAGLQISQANDTARGLLALRNANASFLELVHPDERAATGSLFADSGTTQELVCRALTRHGWRHIAWRVSRASGSPEHTAFFVRGFDVTARVAELQHITRSRELLSEAFDLADLAVLERDLITGSVSATRRLFQLLQLPESGSVPGSIDAFLSAEDTGSLADYRRKIAARQSPAPLSLRLRTATGELRHVRLWERVAYEGERPSRELTLLQDVTEQSLLQAQLRLTDRLTSLGTMAAGVAHEINNPLAFVLGNLNVVKSTLAPLTDIPDVDLVDLKDAVNEAIEGAERVRQIVQSLKAFSRVDENRRVQCDVARVMQASLNMAKNELRHRARIVNDINPVGPVLGNEAKLSQVFLNLLVNAAQAMPDGKSDENTVTVSTRDEGGEVIASVTDTGVGIPPEVLPRIFDPFFSTKKIGEGTGLGLFVSQGIIKEAGGTLTVHSTPGKGTSFEVRLPITLAAFQGSGNTPVPRAKRLRILVVDDEPAILRSIERMLSRHHELTLARSGGEALAHLQANLSYDLMLCDLMMPEISGMDLWEHLTPAQRRRCVFMTGGTFTERASRFMAEAQPPLLEKPFTSLSLEALLQGTISAS